jgi:peptide/nickel transport system substrate-binding protein
MIFKKVFKNYSKRDRNFSALLAGVIVFVLLINIVQGLVYNYKTSDLSGAYNEGIVGEIKQINPLFRDLNSLNRDISSLVYSGLTKYNPNTKSFEPDLATFTINNKSTSYIFTLKEGLEWHDGEPVTIEDVMFTYRTVIQNPGFQNSLLRQSLEGITIENIADNQVEFKLQKPNAFFIAQTDMGILPKHIYEDVPINAIGNEFQDNKLNLIVGSGPYRLASIEDIDDSTTRINLRVFKDYYGEVPKIKNIRLFVYPTDDDLLAKQDNLNSVINLSYQKTGLLDQEKFTNQEYSLPQYTALFLNTDSPKLQERIVRVVLKRGANPTEIVANLADKQPISRPFFQFEAINEINQTDPEVLKELLISDGWTLSDDQLFEKNGQTLEFDLVIQAFSNNERKNQEFKTVVSNLTKTYQKIGIKLRARYYESEQFTKVIADRDYDMVLLGHNLGNNLDSYSFWHSSQTTASGLNLSNYKNIATDSLLETIRETSDISQRNELLVKINEKLVQDVPAIFLYTDKHVFAFDNKVKNRKILGSYAFASDRFYDISTWEFN